MNKASNFFKTTAILSTALFTLLGGCLVEDPIDYTTATGSVSDGGGQQGSDPSDNEGQQDDGESDIPDSSGSGGTVEPGTVTPQTCDTTMSAVASANQSNSSLSLVNVLNTLNSSADLLNSYNLYNFNIDGVNIIYDGGSDMYDGGNIMNTNLMNPISYSEGNISDGTTPFGAGSQYFTKKHDNYWLLAVNQHNIENFRVSGNLGADGGGSIYGGTFEVELGNGDIYRVFYKGVDDGNQGGTGDPSVNHIVFFPTVNSTQTYPCDTNNDEHTVSFDETPSELFYLLVARHTEPKSLSENEIVGIVSEFLSTIQ